MFRETAQGLVTRVVPGFSQEERSQAIDAAVSLLHTMGVTSATEPGTAPLDLYAEKERADALRMRITVLLRGGNSPQSIREAIESYEPLEGVDPGC